jgi:hypothetical protein
MPFPSNKRLPSPPSSMSEAHSDHRHVVSPEEGPRYQFERQGSSDQTWSPVSPNSLRTSQNKVTPSVTERSIESTGWQPPTTSKPKSASHWWPWEWLCELLALGSLGAMIFVLWYYQDRPQADWQQSYFTLNGLIAFLATLIKTGLVIPVSAAIGQRKWLRFLPGGKRKDRARRLGDFETFDEASRGSLGSAKLMISLNAWYDVLMVYRVERTNIAQGCRLLRSLHHNNLRILQCHHAKRAQYIRKLTTWNGLQSPCWQSSPERKF